MGSPDPKHARQLDGMGSGVSSTSKVCILERSEREDADVDFTFVQVGITDGELDWAGNCGNMSSVVGPAALEMGLVPAERVQVERDERTGERVARVRIWNTNTRKVVVARFTVDEGMPPRFVPEGDYAMAGVPGTGSKVVLSFLKPGGAKTGRVLPTGNAIDRIRLSNGREVEASLVDVSNPGVFVRAGLDLLPFEKLTAAEVEQNEATRNLLEEIRREGARMMGLDPDTPSIPKLVFVDSPIPSQGEYHHHLRCRALSMRQLHKAVPLTLGLCLGAAARIPGTIPFLAAQGVENSSGPGSATVRIAHASGLLEVGTTIDENGELLSADLIRTCRILMKGEVYY